MTAVAGPADATEFGVFARVFPAGPGDQVARQIHDSGYTVTQLNLSVLGRPTLDADLTPAAAAQIRDQFSAAGVRIWGVSATFNAIHPDADRRRRDTAAAQHLIERAPLLGAEVVTLCTGTRDPDDMWRAHPDNSSPAAWTDLRQTLRALLPAAHRAHVRLGIEPEPGNVVQDAAAARRLLEEFDHSGDAAALAIVLDPANLLTPDQAADPRTQTSVLTDAFAQLGPSVAALHAKDVVPSGYAAAGVGSLDYALIGRLHGALPARVPVIAQDCSAQDAARVQQFLQQHL